MVRTLWQLMRFKYSHSVLVLNMKRYAKSDGQWLARVDGNSVLTANEWIAHVENEYGVTGIELIETADDVDPREGVLLMPPPGPPPPKDPDTILKEELESATTLVQLKAALIKRFGG